MGSKGTGNLWAEWLEMKPNSPWGFLPTLSVPGAKTVGSELAILQFLGRKVGPSLGGANDDEFQISQELLHQAEELYQKITAKVPTIMAPDKSPDEYNKFMESADKTTHSSQQGLLVYLAQFEEYYVKSGGKDGKFTSSGTTVGEIKLFATLQILLKLKADLLASYPKLSSFVKALEGNEKVKSVVDGRAKNINGQFGQYFICPA